MSKKSLKLFFNYAHEDENYRDELVKHLSMLKKLGVIEEWYDRKLIAGDSLDSEIIEKLESSHIILFLVSSDFLSSKYCYEEELKKALELKKEGKVRLIAIVVRSVDWEGAPFAEFVMLPKDVKPVDTWDNRDVAWTAVAMEIRKVCEKMLSEFDIKDPHGAHEYIEIASNLELDKILIGQEIKYDFHFSQPNPVLSLNARISFSHEAGSSWVMKIIVNNMLIRDQQLLNKAQTKEIGDGRVRPWFSSSTESWQLVYSPSFKANYFNERYRVINSDPYFFVFDLSEAQTINGKYEVIIKHIGLKSVEAHNNPIIVKDVSIR